MLPEHDDSDSIDSNPNGWLGRRFTANEVKTTAKTLLNNKACGWDSIPNEFIKNAPHQLFLLLSLLFNKMRDSNQFPKDWNKCRITLLHKRGCGFNLGNYRPITVLISLAALYSKVLNLRLTKVVEKHNLLGEVQGGFRKGRGCADNTFVLHSVLWKARSKRRSVHLAFLDIAKAYDSVNRNVLWKKLMKMGIDGKFLCMLQSVYQGDSVVNGVSTRSIFLQRGLRQGCSLSPMLFNLYVSEMSHDLMLSNEGFYIGPVICISVLFFADDIVLVSRTAAGLLRLLALAQKHALILKLDISEEKSQIISPKNKNWNLSMGDGSKISLKQVLHYKYLGIDTFSTMFKTLGSNLKKKVLTSRKYMYGCLHLAKSSSDPVKLAMATWENIAVPSILFGCESLLFSDAKLLELERVGS